MGELIKEGFRCAANLVMAKPLHKIYSICEKQSSISTSKLYTMADKAQDQYREHGVVMRKLIDEITRLKKQIEGMKCDAERYKWLRDNVWNDNMAMIVTLHMNESWDNAIDQAMKDGIKKSE